MTLRIEVDFDLASAAGQREGERDARQGDGYRRAILDVLRSLAADQLIAIGRMSAGDLRTWASGLGDRVTRMSVPVSTPMATYSPSPIEPTMISASTVTFEARAAVRRRGAADPAIGSLTRAMDRSVPPAPVPDAPSASRSQAMAQQRTQFPLGGFDQAAYDGAVNVHGGPSWVPINGCGCSYCARARSTDTVVFSIEPGCGCAPCSLAQAHVDAMRPGPGNFFVGGGTMTATQAMERMERMTQATTRASVQAMRVTAEPVAPAPDSFGSLIPGEVVAPPPAPMQEARNPPPPPPRTEGQRPLGGQRR